MKYLFFDDSLAGRITELRKGTPKHAVSVKCYCHNQCSQLKIAKSLPVNAFDRMMIWLFEGCRQHPQVGMSKEHIRMFRVFCYKLC